MDGLVTWVSIRNPDVVVWMPPMSEADEAFMFAVGWKKVVVIEVEQYEEEETQQCPLAVKM